MSQWSEPLPLNLLFPGLECPSLPKPRDLVDMCYFSFHCALGVHGPDAMRLELSVPSPTASLRPDHTRCQGRPDERQSPWKAYSSWSLVTCSMRRRLLCSSFSAQHRHSWEACRTYFRVSLLLQVEQEKQFTHQALLSADTTVMGRWGWGLADFPQATSRPSCAK